MLDKFKASGLHLLISAIIIISFLLLVYFVWYPYPLYEIEGLSQVTIILFAVDLILGPLLTLILYKKGKKYLFLDLSIIITIQISAFAYGAVTITNSRPVYIVFAVDRFNTISQTMIDINTLEDKSLKYSLFSQPIYIYTAPPNDPQESNNLLMSVLSGGKDIEQLPQYYQPYLNNIALVKARALTYTQKNKKYLDSIIRSNQNQYLLKDISVLPLFGKNKEVLAVISSNGKVIDYINTHF